MPTIEERAALLEEKVAKAKAEILADIASGRVPGTVARFGQLHDFVDANCYGGMCDDDEFARLIELWGGVVQIGCMMDATPPDLQDFANELQDEIDRWLAAGRPST